MSRPDYEILADARRARGEGALGRAVSAWKAVEAFSKHAGLAGAQRVAAIASKTDEGLARIWGDRAVPEDVRLLQHHAVVRRAREELLALRGELTEKFNSARAARLLKPADLPIAPHAEALLMAELRPVRKDPLAWSMLYRSADRLTAQTMERMPPVLFTKNGTARVEPAVTDEARAERWLADLSPEDRAAYDAVRETEVAVNSLVAAVLNEATKLAGSVTLPPPPDGEGGAA